MGNIRIGIYAPYWNFWSYSNGSSFKYNASEIKKVDITWVSGEIDVVMGEGTELTVAETSEGLSDDAKMHYYIKDDKLTIHYSKAMLKEDIDPEKKHLRVEIPSGIELDIDSVNANVTIGDAVLGRIKLTSISGNAKFGSVISNEIKTETIEGTFSAVDIVADKFISDSVSGAVSISTISANEIKLKTVSGKTDMYISKKSKVKVSGVSGEVSLDIAENTGATVEFSTMSGTFSSDKPHKTNNKTYIFGKGETEITVETVNGNLNIS
jgi:DUF4097 and DUF4098 domain-containing protein YvlB